MARKLGPIQQWAKEREVKVQSQDFKIIVDKVRKQIMDELSQGLETADYHNSAFIKLHMHDCESMRQDIRRLQSGMPEPLIAQAMPYSDKYIDEELSKVHAAISDLYKREKELNNKLKNPRELLRLSIDTFKLGEKDEQQRQEHDRQLKEESEEAERELRRDWQAEQLAGLSGSF